MNLHNLWHAYYMSYVVLFIELHDLLRAVQRIRMIYGKLLKEFTRFLMCC